MRFPFALVLHVIYLYTVLILFSPATITAFNITRLLQTYDECRTFNLLLSETKMDEQINNLKPPFTLLVVTQDSPSLTELRHTNVLKNVLYRHIILDYINEDQIEDMFKFDKKDYSFSSLSTVKSTNKSDNVDSRIRFLPQVNGTENSVHIAFLEYEGGELTIQGTTFLKGMKKPMPGRISLLIVWDLLYDRVKEAPSDIEKEQTKALFYPDAAKANAPSALALMPPPESSNKGVDDGIELSKSTSNHSSTTMFQPFETSAHGPPQFPPSHLESDAPAIQIRAALGLMLLGILLMTPG